MATVHVTGRLPDLATERAVELRFTVRVERTLVNCVAEHPIEPEMESDAKYYWVRDTGESLGVYCIRQLDEDGNNCPGHAPGPPPRDQPYVSSPLWVVLAWIRRDG